MRQNRYTIRPIKEGFLKHTGVVSFNVKKLQHKLQARLIKENTKKKKKTRNVPFKECIASNSDASTAENLVLLVTVLRDSAELPHVFPGLVSKLILVARNHTTGQQQSALKVLGALRQRFKSNAARRIKHPEHLQHY